MFLINPFRFGGGGGGTVFEQDGASVWTTLNGGDMVDGFSGQKWSNGSARTIDKFSFRLGVIGSITGKTYRAYVYSLTGENLNAILATSAQVAGSNAWDGTQWVDFTFASPYTTAPSTYYGLVVKCEQAQDVNNYARTFFNSGLGTLNGYVNVWNAAGTSVGYNTEVNDHAMQIHCS